MVVAANLVLSLVVGIAVWNQKPQAKKENSEASSTQAQRSSSPISSNSQTGTKQPEEESQKTAQVLYPASSRSQEQAISRKNAGRNDPMQLAQLASDEEAAPAESFQTSQKGANSGRKSTNGREQIAYLPPPPPVVHLGNGYIPPLYNTDPRHTSRIGSESKKREPAYKVHGIKVSGIIGDRAILIMRPEGSRMTDRPESLCLSAGDEVRTITKVPVSIESVEKDRVTFKVAGELCVKRLPDIR